jgi:hypothetical protein
MNIMEAFDFLNDLGTNRIKFIRDLALRTGATKIGIAH